MLGMGSRLGERNREVNPQIADGANRCTVQQLGTTELIEVMSYGHYKKGDCVKVLARHPTGFPHFFELKPGERCDWQLHGRSRFCLQHQNAKVRPISGYVSLQTR